MVDNEHPDHGDQLWSIAPVERSPELHSDVTEAAGLAEADDHVHPLNERAQRILAGHLPGQHVAVVADGALVGYAQVDPADSSVQLFVVPERRREGIGRALAETIRATCPDRPSWWSFGTLPAARALAGALGLEPIRELLKMALTVAGSDLETPAATEDGKAPDGITISGWTPADTDDLVAVNALAFADHPEQGRMSAQDVIDRSHEDWFDPDGLLLARDAAGRLVGFHWTKLETDPDGRRVGEIFILGVHPFEHGRGLGRHLLAIGLAHLVARGAEIIELYVEGGNERVVRMYERASFAVVTRDTSWA